MASVTVETFRREAEKGRRAALPRRARGFYTDSGGYDRMDAASAAKDRVDRALALLERRLLDLKSRAAGSSRVPEDDLFAPQPSSETDRARIHELEAAGRDAAEALARAADAIRETLSEQEGR
ncbi:hypothetical protein [Brevundimonas sp.]|uniref:hypothetical protein n=1 Tax=Brevundimonas sp. TaxID=1871086 RepID=UPI003F6E7E7B